MAAEDCLRLAWEAEHDGRHRLRDSLLTLAVVESGPEHAWAERCRARLVADRSDHFLAAFPTVPDALVDPRVRDARDRLRAKYPEGRVAGLLLRSQARRGPYTGRVEALEALVEDLAGPQAEAENVRRDAPQAARGPLARARSGRTPLVSLDYAEIPGRYPAWDGGGEEDGLAVTVYVVLVLFLDPRQYRDHP